jgi:hypothetical protein
MEVHRQSSIDGVSFFQKYVRERERRKMPLGLSLNTTGMFEHFLCGFF